MEDVSSKFSTLRRAKARSVLDLNQTALKAIREDSIPEGDPLVIAETAALSAAKRTPILMPHSHNARLENIRIDFSIGKTRITIEAELEASEKADLKMHALNTASVAAMNLYQLLEPWTENPVIEESHIVSESGGYSQFKDTNWKPGELSAAVLVASDRVSTGEREDRSGHLLRTRLEEKKFVVSNREVVPDERVEIREVLESWVEDGIDLIATTGGTGPTPRDVTVEATRDVMDRSLPGLAEAMRSYGQRRLPYSMFSRGIAAQCSRSLIVNFPGSTGGVKDGINALFPGLHHFFDVRGDGPEPQALDDRHGGN